MLHLLRVLPLPCVLPFLLFFLLFLSACAPATELPLEDAQRLATRMLPETRAALSAASKQATVNDTVVLGLLVHNIWPYSQRFRILLPPRVPAHVEKERFTLKPGAFRIVVITLMPNASGEDTLSFPVEFFDDGKGGEQGAWLPFAAPSLIIEALHGNETQGSLSDKGAFPW